jgi:hypothetical protein
MKPDAVVRGVERATRPNCRIVRKPFELVEASSQAPDRGDQRRQRFLDRCSHDDPDLLACRARRRGRGRIALQQRWRARRHRERGVLSTSLVAEIDGSRGSELVFGSGSLITSGTLGTFNREMVPRGFAAGRVVDSTAIRRGAIGCAFSVFVLLDISPPISLFRQARVIRGAKNRNRWRHIPARLPARWTDR